VASESSGPISCLQSQHNEHCCHKVVCGQQCEQMIWYRGTTLAYLVDSSSFETAGNHPGPNMRKLRTFMYKLRSIKNRHLVRGDRQFNNERFETNLRTVRMARRGFSSGGSEQPVNDEPRQSRVLVSNDCSGDLPWGARLARSTVALSSLWKTKCQTHDCVFSNVRIALQGFCHRSPRPFCIRRAVQRPRGVDVRCFIRV
jgi:hypothetical protein